MSQPVERRGSFRLPFISSATCHVELIDKKYNGKLRDLSENGIFMETDDYLDVGNQCDIEIFLEGEDNNLNINNISGRILRRDKNGVAICFDERLKWFSLVRLYFC